jgi:hypothetical protein
METNQSTRPATAQEKEVLEYLNDLRSSGATNMFGARPYIESEFMVDKKEASRLLTLWMSNYNEKCDYEQVKL